MTDRIRIVEAPAIMKVPPPRATFYGQPKIGKTTFASMWPNPVFVQTEDGAAGLAVAKIPETPCQSWDELMDCLRFIVKDPQDRKTVVIDTLDRAEALAQKKVKLEHFDDDDGKFMSYHKGPAIAGKMIAELLYALDVIRKTHDMNIVLLAHDGLAPGANALGEDFKKWAPSLSKQAWGIVRDWSDQIGHLNLLSESRKARQGSLAMSELSNSWVVLLAMLDAELATKCRTISHLVMMLTKSTWESESVNSLDEVIDIMFDSDEIKKIEIITGNHSLNLSISY